MASDLKVISEEQFYQDETKLHIGFSGSGGYFLDEDIINWTLKAEKAFKKRGIELKDYDTRHFIIGMSFFNMSKYKQALKQFKDIKDQYDIEKTEWVMSNRGRDKGKLKIKEYVGGLPSETGTEIVTIENDNYKFVSFFKGPIYRYDKKKNSHAIVYRPASQYDWCTQLKLEGDNLIFRLRDYSEDHVFNNVTHELKSPSATSQENSFSIFNDI